MFVRDGYDASKNVVREYIAHSGEVLATTVLENSVLPLYFLDFRDDREPRYVRNLKRTKRSDAMTLHRLLAVTTDGKCVIVPVKFDGIGQIQPEEIVEMKSLCDLIATEAFLPPFKTPELPF